MHINTPAPAGEGGEPGKVGGVREQKGRGGGGSELNSARKRRRKRGVFVTFARVSPKQRLCECS